MSGLSFYLSLEHSYLFAECRHHLQADIDAKLEGFARGAALQAARQQHSAEGVGVEGVEVEGELEVSAFFERCCLGTATGEREPLYDQPGAWRAATTASPPPHGPLPYPACSPFQPRPQPTPPGHLLLAAPRPLLGVTHGRAKPLSACPGLSRRCACGRAISRKSQDLAHARPRLARAQLRDPRVAPRH
jgi:hypothetical protein